jgi:hypothetical protein
VDTCEVKIADFGLSALVRLDEDGYDAEESGKRKRYTALKEVSEQCGVCVALCSCAHCGRAFAALRADCVCQYAKCPHHMQYCADDLQPLDTLHLQFVVIGVRDVTAGVVLSSTTQHC